MEFETDIKGINIKKLYSIKDVVVGEFGDLMIFPNQSSALRQFNYYMKKVEEQGRNTNDYELFCVGQINLETGEILPSVEFIQQGVSK